MLMKYYINFICFFGFVNYFWFLEYIKSKDCINNLLIISKVNLCYGFLLNGI